MFSIPLGKLENQIDLFSSSGGTTERETHIFMRDGWFYVANGNSGKVMVFSSYGDLIFLLYNPVTNPAPVLLNSVAPAAAAASPGAGGKSRGFFPWGIP